MRIVLEEIIVRRGSASITADLVLEEGLHVIHGPVGCGKSTLALAIARLYPLSAGCIFYEGIRSSALSLQFPEYHVTGITLAEECLSWGNDPQKILSSVSMADRADQKTLSLSRGELKRFLLACVLEKPCDLLILDEPFSTLDCNQKESLCDRLSGHTNSIIVLFTHECEILPEHASFFKFRNGTLVRLDNYFQAGMCP